MPSQIKEMLHDIPHHTKRGLEFRLKLSKKQLTPEHNYWLYFINAENSELGFQNFSVFVTKQSFPMESVADHLASTLAIEEAKIRLEEADENGRPLKIPFLTEGWVLL